MGHSSHGFRISNKNWQTHTIEGTDGAPRLFEHSIEGTWRTLTLPDSKFKVGAVSKYGPLPSSFDMSLFL